MLKAYKVRLETNNKQRSFFSRCAGVSRFVYNWGLAEMRTRYYAGEKPYPLKLCVEFNAQKRENCPFVTEVPYAITESAFRNLDTAYKNFFRRIKQGKTGKDVGFPKFKSRYKPRSFQLRGVKVFDDAVYIPLLGNIRLSQSGYIPVGADYGVYATVSEYGGNWFISILVDDGDAYPETVETGNVIGVDVGIKTLAQFSDGHAIDNPKATYKLEKKLARLQREQARRTKGGKNRAKTVKKIAKVHARITNVRRHAQHVASNYAVDHGDVIVVENLNVSGMLKNDKLAKSVSDAGFYEIRRQIEYKARYTGKKVIVANTFYPSTKLCSGCGSKKPMTLKERVYICPECGLVIDRDLNAAINLAALAEL